MSFDMELDFGESKFWRQLKLIIFQRIWAWPGVSRCQPTDF